MVCNDFRLFHCLSGKVVKTQGEQRRMVLVVNFFEFLNFFFFACDLVQYMQAIFHFPYVQTASGNLKLQFHGYHLYFRKDFQMLLAFNLGLV